MVEENRAKISDHRCRIEIHRPLKRGKRGGKVIFCHERPERSWFWLTSWVWFAVRTAPVHPICHLSSSNPSSFLNPPLKILSLLRPQDQWLLLAQHFAFLMRSLTGRPVKLFALCKDPCRLRPFRLPWITPAPRLLTSPRAHQGPTIGCGSSRTMISTSTTKSMKAKALMLLKISSWCRQYLM